MRGEPADVDFPGGPGLPVFGPNGLDKCFVRACMCAVLDEEGCQFAVGKYVQCVTVVRVGEKHVYCHAYCVEFAYIVGTLAQGSNCDDVGGVCCAGEGEAGTRPTGAVFRG